MDVRSPCGSEECKGKNRLKCSEGCRKLKGYQKLISEKDASSWGGSSLATVFELPRRIK